MQSPYFVNALALSALLVVTEVANLACLAILRRVGLVTVQVALFTIDCALPVFMCALGRSESRP
jgi:hypothetical protein